MKHYLNVEFATVYGIRTSTIITYFDLWASEKDNSKGIIVDNNYWIKGNLDNLSSFFVYLNPRKISYTIKKLVLFGFVEVKKINSSKFDHTNYYRLTDAYYEVINLINKREKKSLTSGQKWYAKYLKSEHWLNLSDRIKQDRKCCELCNSTKNLVVHHLTYENIYNELDEDLQLLCKKCHCKVHNLYISKEVL